MGNNIKKGFVWVAIERFSLQIVQFIIGIVIARFITPSEYGILGVLMVFITMSQVFIDSGLGSALIYRNNLYESDLQTTFTFNFIISCAIIFFIYLSSDYIENLIGVSKLSIYLRVCIFVLLPNAFVLVPTSILKIKMNFKEIAISNVISTIISGCLGIIYAIMGYGIWALVIQLVSKSVIQSLLLILQCRWIPKFDFSIDSFLGMYNYSIALFGTSCISKITDHSISLFIAKLLTPYSLGIITRANQFATLAGSSIGSIFSTVLFPAFSAIKNDTTQFILLQNKMLKYQGLFVIPIFFFLAVLSKPIVIILLTEKWIEVVPILQILCIGRIFSTISLVTEQAICSIGRSDLEFKQQLFKLMLKIILIVVGFKWGLYGIAYADAFSTLLSFFITNHFASRCMHLSTKKQLKILSPYLLSSFLAAIVCYFIMSFLCNVWLELVFGAFIYIIVYSIIIIILCDESSILIKNIYIAIIRRVFKKNKSNY